MPDIGSSPLSQGTFVHILHLIVPLRLIPATAENTKRHRTHASSLRLIPARTGSIRVTRQTEAPTPAHPRSRGDYTRFEITRWSCKGSSPLARGTYPAPYNGAATARLIPARAGNIFGLEGGIGVAPAHPRSRGEHFALITTGMCAIGSSPLARGTYGGAYQPYALARLIPARAGNILRLGGHPALAAAHPRSRGEHSLLRLRAARMSGSSPLARGTS